MVSIDDGGPAFCSAYGNDGISLRDWFAGTITVTARVVFPDEAQAVKLLGSVCPDPDDDPAGWLAWVTKLEAHIRYVKADAMLARRSLEPLDPEPSTP